MNDVLLGFMVGAWAFMLLVGGYVVYHLKGRWDVLRRDIVALEEGRKKLEFDLAQAKAELQQEIGLRKVIAMTDEEQALAEAKARLRKGNW